MTHTPLTSAEKKKFRGTAQRLKPHVHIGKNGLSQTALQEIDTALTKNGLIKLRFEADKATIKAHIESITNLLHCEYAGGVGKTGVFFRSSRCEPPRNPSSH